MSPEQNISQTNSMSNGGTQPQQSLQKPHKKTKLIIALIIVAAIVVAVIVVYFQLRVSNDEISIRVTAEDVIKSGQETSLRISYANNDSGNTLTESSVKLSVPTNFIFVSSDLDPVSEESLEWNLGDIESGTEQSFEVRGIFYGDADAALTVAANLDFTPSGFGGEQEITSSLAINIAAPSFALDLDAPESVNAGSEVTYEFEITNTESTTYTDYQVEFIYPEGFTPTAQEPEPNTGEIWQLEDFEPNETIKVTVRGRLDGTTDERKNIGVQAGNVDVEGNFFLQLSISDVTVIAAPTITVTQSSSLETANAGEQIKYIAKVTNVGNSALTNLSLRMRFDSLVVDPSSIAIDSGGRLDGTTIIWDNTVIDGLRVLEPNKSFEVGYSLSTYESLTPQEKDFTIVSTPEITSGEQTIGGEVVTTKIRTELESEVAASTFDDDGEPIGSGPTTPKVGQTTTYRTSWDFASKYNEVSNAKVSCTIPIGATYVTSKVDDRTKFVYDDVAKTFIWDLGTMPSKTAKPSNADIAGTVDISITPSIANSGDKMQLAKSCRFVGTDAFTNEEISFVIEEITSETVNP